MTVSGIDGKWEITGSDHVRITQGKVVVEKGGSRQATSQMPTTLAVRTIFGIVLSIVRIWTNRLKKKKFIRVFFKVNAL